MGELEVDAVEGINKKFYEAFESLSLENMDQVWSHEKHVKCIHPGWDILSEWEPIRRSWETIFSNTEEIHFELSDVKIEARGDTAWIVLVENISMRAQGRIMLSSVLATNIFEKKNGRWLMVHHHASRSPVNKFAPQSKSSDYEVVTELLR